MLRFQIILQHLKKFKKFKRYIIINEDFRNMKTIELSIEKYSQISVYMTRRSIIYSEQQLSLLWCSSSPTIVGEQLVHKKVNLLTYKERCKFFSVHGKTKKNVSSKRGSLLYSCLGTVKYSLSRNKCHFSVFWVKNQSFQFVNSILSDT